MTEDIQPSHCHHCGGPALVQFLRSGWRVMCYEVDTRTSCQTVGRNSWKRLEAIQLWNALSEGDSAPASLSAPQEQAEQEVDLTESLFA